MKCTAFCRETNIVLDEKSTKYRRNGNNRNPIGTLMQVVTQTCVARFLLHDFIERTMRQRLSVYENVTGLSCCVQHAGKSASQNYLLNVYYWDVEKLSLVPTQESVCEWRATFQDRFFFYLGVSFIFLSHFVLFCLTAIHSMNFILRVQCALNSVKTFQCFRHRISHWMMTAAAEFFLCYFESLWPKRKFLHFLI